MTPANHLQDVDAILAVTNAHPGEVLHPVASDAGAMFTWDYAKGARPQLETLYEKAKTGQWNGSTDLDWTTDVDPERIAVELGARDGRMKCVRAIMDEKGSPVAHWGEKEFNQYAVENLAHRASQFLHGEQGALLCTARIVETVPWIDAKYYASTQVMDEARHVAFGVLSLQEAYADISGAELRERQEFVFEAAIRMRDRFLHQEVWERLGVAPRDIVPYFVRQQSEEEVLFQRMLFAKIVPNCKKVGLLDGRDGWLHTRFTELGVIDYENHVDTTAEYAELGVR